MSIKDRSQWKGSSILLRVEQHEQLRRLLDTLGTDSLTKLVGALLNDPEKTVAALKPLVNEYQEVAQRAALVEKRERAAKRTAAREIASLIDALPPEEREKLLATARSNAA